MENLEKIIDCLEQPRCPFCEKKVLVGQFKYVERCFPYLCINKKCNAYFRLPAPDWVIDCKTKEEYEKAGIRIWNRYRYRK